MSYTKQNFLSGQVVTHDNLNRMENGIVAAGNAANLLDNSNFADPVNQRGETIYSASGTYTFDRWIMSFDSSGMVNVGDGYVATYSSGGYVDIAQICEHASRMTGKAYTFAVMQNGGTSPMVLNFTFGTAANASFLDGQITLIHYNEDRVIIRSNTNGGWIGYLWAALYEGTYTVDTLPDYVPKGYAKEFAECRRYFASPVGRFTPVAMTTASNARMCLMLEAPMRVVPTATLLNKDNVLLNISGSGKTLGVTAASTYSMEGNLVYVDLTCSGGTSSNLYATGTTFLTSIALSADT